MKIVFWAPVHGQTRQSSNMLAVAFVSALRENAGILMTQTQFCMNDLEDAVVGRTSVKEMRERFYRDMGIDAVSRCIKRKQLERSDLENCCINILPDSELMLLPGSKAGSYGVHCEALYEILPYVLREAERYFEYVLIDTNPGMDYVSQKMIDIADVVVVNLSQNMGVVEPLFRNFPEILKTKKVFYLFGSYLADSCYSLHNIRFRYDRINRKNSGVIPLNIGYMDAISSGRVMDYFATNMECEQGDVNFRFIKEVREASERLLCFAEGAKKERMEQG